MNDRFVPSSGRTLKNKFIAALSVILIITSSVTALITYKLHTNIAETEISEQFAQRVEQVAARVDMRLQEVHRASDQIVLNREVKKLVQEHHDEVVSAERRVELERLLNEYLYSLPHTLSLYVFDLEGNYYMANGGSLLYEFGAKAKEQMDELLLQSSGELVWQRGSTLGSPAKIFYQDRGPVILAARWMVSRDADVYGILIMVLHERILASELNKVITGNEGKVFLFDRRGSLLYTDEDQEEKGSTTPISLLHSIDEPGVRNVNNKPYLFAKAEAMQTRFQLVSSISMADIRGKSRVIPQISLVSALVTVILASILVAATTNRLLYPLRILVRGMKRVEAGNLNARVRIETNDELAFIGKRFNSMLDYIDILIKERYEKRLREREAELTALQAQLNPHFLYNTLDLFHSRMYMRDDYETAELVVNLSELLRYALEPVTELTTLKDEMIQIENYLNLQKARSFSNLSIEIDIAEQVLHCTIPRLLLQPIVENAFVHAFRNQRGMKQLVIRAYRQKHFLVIEVQDNGCGFPEERFRALFDRYQVADLDKEPGEQDKVRGQGQGQEREQIGRTRGSLGLRNVIRRIELIYGAPYRMELESTSGSSMKQGTIIRLYLPYEYLPQSDQNIG